MFGKRHRSAGDVSHPSNPAEQVERSCATQWCCWRRAARAVTRAWNECLAAEGRERAELWQLLSRSPVCCTPESVPLEPPRNQFVMNRFPTSSSQNIRWHDTYDQINDAGALAAQRHRCDAAAMKYPNLVAVDCVEIGHDGGPLQVVGEINHLMATTTLTQ